MKPKYNHTRFKGDLVKALHTWAEEDQDCDLKYEMELNGDDPNKINDILEYWAYDQLVEFIEWLFEETDDARHA